MIDLKVYDNAVTRYFPQLHLVALDVAQHDRTYGNWYTVTYCGKAHASFRTRAALATWLRRTGLVRPKPLPAQRGTWAAQALAGEYRQATHLSADSYLKHRRRSVEEFQDYEGGRITTWFVTHDDDGIHTLHVCSASVPWRDEVTDVEAIVRLKAEIDRGR